MADVVDWDLAVATAVRVAPTGPVLARHETDEAVADLRACAAAAVEPVRTTSRLAAPDGSATTVVVDRPEWIRSNVAGFAVVLAPMLDKMRARTGGLDGVVSAVGSRATAVQMGLLLGWLSGKVLGQFEAFTAPGAQPRLLLVAPSIVSAERELGVPGHDFRQWVALHEETHRVQFGAVPWLADHVLAEVHDLVRAADADGLELLARVRDAAAAVARGGSLLDAVQSPEQKAVLDRITAVMSLLEGHADVVMDDVGPAVVPSVRLIRERFDKRRHEPGAVDGLLRRLLGLDAKMRQYADGAAFVRAVVGVVGIDGFNAVWSSPETLPTIEEIADPSRWVGRVRP
jgi:coenzyme F420 biosynthesis associated uncharacterized protein